MEATKLENLAIDKLKQTREAKRISQLELSLRSNVSQNMIAYIESKKRHPTLSTIIKLCVALEINPAELFMTSKSDTIKDKEAIYSLIEKYFI